MEDRIDWEHIHREVRIIFAFSSTHCYVQLGERFGEPRSSWFHKEFGIRVTVGEIMKQSLQADQWDSCDGPKTYDDTHVDGCFG